MALGWDHYKYVSGLSKLACINVTQSIYYQNHVVSRKVVCGLSVLIGYNCSIHQWQQCYCLQGQPKFHHFPVIFWTELHLPSKRLRRSKYYRQYKCRTRQCVLRRKHNPRHHIPVFTWTFNSWLTSNLLWRIIDMDLRRYVFQKPYIWFLPHFS